MGTKEIRAAEELVRQYRETQGGVGGTLREYEDGDGGLYWKLYDSKQKDVAAKYGPRVSEAICELRRNMAEESEVIRKAISESASESLTGLVEDRYSKIIRELEDALTEIRTHTGR